MPPASLIALPGLAALSFLPFLGPASSHRIHSAEPHAAPALLELGQGLPPKALIAPLLASASSALAPPQAAARRSSHLSARRAADGRRQGWGATATGARQGVATPSGKQDAVQMPHGFPEEAGPRFEAVPARIMGPDSRTGDPWRDILLPADWAWELQPGSAEFIPGEATSNPRMVGVALSASNLEVKFGVWQTRDAATRRHLRISEMLSGSGIVPRIMDIRAHPEETFVLTESPGTRTLAALMADWQQRGVPPGEPVVPLDEALPLMVDMLEGLAMMEWFGVSHGDLTEANIYVVDGAPVLTLFDDFRSACVATSADGEISCRGLADTICGSALRHAPEMVNGVPARVSDNVWQLGLVFANLLLGDYLSVWQDRAFDDSTAIGRQGIREFMQREFSIWDAAFPKLDKEFGDVLRILAGMLETDPKRRMTTDMALRRARQVAARRGIPLRREGSAQEAVPQWEAGYAYADGM